MDFLPIFLDLKGRSAVVAGGGATATRKVRLLRKAGARVTVVAPRLDAELAGLAAEGAIVHHARAFASGDLEGAAVVFGATGDDAEDARIAAAAQAAGVPVNIVDRPGVSTFIMPAIVERDPIVIGISSGGAAPVLVRRLRERLESLLPAGLGRLARFADSFRAAVRATLPDETARRRFWERFFDGPLADAVLRGEPNVRERMIALVNRPENDTRGIVHIVGAGPGDPDLLTFRALRVMQQADVVIYDRLVEPAILDYVRRDAERVYVGKAKGAHSRTQAEINDLMVAHARAGRRVVRLKGGDPFVFGRGGEELEHLRAHGVEVEVVPGITAALCCAAATGIPLTHRDHAAAVTLVTGHGRDGAPDVDWAALAHARHTLVVYMAVSTAGEVARRLIEHGLPAATPVAVIENGTRPSQRTVAGRLDRLAELVAAHAIAGPAVIIIGEVARAAQHGSVETVALARAVNA